MLPLPVVRPLSAFRRLQRGRSAGKYLAYLCLAPILLVASGVVFCSLAHADTQPTAHFVSAPSVVPSSVLSSPGGVAVDARGDVYIGDAGNARVLKETLLKGSYSESTVASSGLNEPGGVAVDALGNVYIADTGNNRVLKETPSSGGYTQSRIACSALNTPTGVAVDVAGNVYIADTGNHRVLKETPAGDLYTESTVASMGLSAPIGVAVDILGNVYISDTGNNRVLKETLSDGVYSESTIASSGLDYPWGVAVDAQGNVYIADHSGSNSVLKEAPAAGSYTQSALTSFAGGPSSYSSGVAVDASGNNIYYADIYRDWVVKLQTETVDFGPVNVNSPSSPISLLFSFDTGGTLGTTDALTLGTTGLDFVNDVTGSCTLYGIYASGDVCTVDVTFKPLHPGVRMGAGVLIDTTASGNIIAAASLTGSGVGPQVSFLPGGPQTTLLSGIPFAFGLAVDADGNVFVDDGAGGVYKDQIPFDDVSQSQTPISTILNVPAGIAVDGSGIVYVVDSQFLYKFTLLNGFYSQSTIATVTDDLIGLAVDQNGNLYSVGSATGNVYKWALNKDGSYLQTQIGNAGVAATGVAVDGSGNVFACNPNSGQLYEEALEADGSYVQSVLAGGLTGPISVAVDGGGNLYIAGSAQTAPYNGEIYKEALQPDGTYIQASFAGPANLSWVAVDGFGNLYLSQYTASSNVFEVAAQYPSSLSFATTNVGSTSTDSPQIVTLANIGSAPLVFPAPGSGTNPSIGTNFTLDSSSTCPQIGSSGTAGSLAAGSSCTYAVDFAPAAGGSISGSMILTDNNVNATGPPYGIQTVVLSGTGFIPYATQTTVSVSPNPVTLGQPVTIIATVIDTATSATSPWGGGVTFTDSVGGVTVTLNGGAAVALSGGTATLTVTPSVAGVHTITANYVDGCGCFAGSSGQFSLTVTAASLELTSSSGGGTVEPGEAAAYHLMVAPGSGPTYPNAVTFTATGLPSGATAAFSPATVPGGSGATPVTMTIQTSKGQTARTEKPSLRGTLGPMAWACLLLPLAGCKRARLQLRRMPGLPAVLVAATLSLGAMVYLSGCGASGFDQAPQSYTVVATATDAVTGAHSSVNVTLTVE